MKKLKYDVDRHSERYSLNYTESFVKMPENNSPEYVKFILPDQIGKTRPNLRNAENIVIAKCRREMYMYRTSLILSTTCVWNKFPKASWNMEYVS